MMTALVLLLSIADNSAFAAPPVADDQLADMRGGFRIAGGPDISMAVRTETALDGNLLLRSVYTVDQGQATLLVYAPAAGEKVAVARTTAPPARESLGPDSMSISFDRQTGIRMTPAAPFESANVQVMTDAMPAGPQEETRMPLDLSNGPVATGSGTVSLNALPVGSRVQLQGDQVNVSHIFGQAFGSVIANTADNRAIESATTVSLDLQGATPYNLGSAALRAEGVALDAVRQMVGVR
jgi:hypothetical protein